jgi:hypothetical protein
MAAAKQSEKDEEKMKMIMDDDQTYSQVY